MRSHDSHKKVFDFARLIAITASIVLLAGACSLLGPKVETGDVRNR